MKVKEAYIINIRNLREDSDLTQEDVANELGIKQSTYSRYERGINELPIHHLINICLLYNVSADYILGLKNARVQYKK